MNLLTDRKKLLSHRGDFAALLFTVAMVANLSEGTIAQAAWPTFPLGRSRQIEESPKSNAAFPPIIRKLLSEAKKQEDLGNLDRAILLADRAVLAAQSSTKTGNPLPESSNEFLAHYANDLRQKKVVATTRVQQETLARRQPQRPNAGTETPDIPAISKRSLTAADSQINRKALLSRQLDFDNVEEADSVATSAAGRLPANPANPWRTKTGTS